MHGFSPYNPLSQLSRKRRKTYCAEKEYSSFGQVKKRGGMRMNEQEQVNEGYVIIESVTVGNARFVIGENPNNQAAPYVTWQANVKNDPNNFFWGHYCATKLGAVADFGRRITEEA